MHLECIDIVRLLINRGAAVNLKDRVWTRTGLFKRDDRIFVTKHFLFVCSNVPLGHAVMLLHSLYCKNIGDFNMFSTLCVALKHFIGCVILVSCVFMNGTYHLQILLILPLSLL